MSMHPGNFPSGNIGVAIIGAGPYGLSIAAHLSASGVPFRIFGKPMGFWQTQMPEGMKLKSEGFASSLYDAEGEFTLAEYSRRKGLPYADTGLPVPLETFVSYGIAFQKKFVPQVEDKRVLSVEKLGEQFELVLEDGEVFCARNVVVAVGISYFAQLPRELAGLGGEFVSHSSAHSSLEGFRGKRVAVLGAGASAADLAALLRGKGAQVQLIARGARLRFHDPPPAHRSLKDKLLRPITGIGPGLRLAFYVKAPHIFRRLPESLRLRKMKETLGPAPGWFIKDQVVGKLPIHTGAKIGSAEVENGEAVLRWSGRDGEEHAERFDHVIAATGFDVDVQRLEFLSPAIRTGLRTTGKSPLLSARFESSIGGLYFAGVASANTFGPLMRFAYGAGFAARRISKRLAAVARKTQWASESISTAPGGYASENAGGKLQES